MWFLLFLFSTATSLIPVDGRPQAPDLSKLPPGKGAVTSSRELLTRGADGASLTETGNPTEPPSTTTDSAATDSAAVQTTESYESTDPELTPFEESRPIDTSSGGEAGDDGEFFDTEESSADGESSGAAAFSGDSEDSVDSPRGGEVEGDDPEVAAEESSTVASSATPPPPTPEPAAAETEAPEPEVVETEAPETAQTSNPASATTEAATEPAQETEEPVTEADPAAEGTTVTEPAPKAEEPVTAAAPTIGGPGTGAATATPGQATTEAVPTSETSQAAEPTTAAAETESGSAAPGSEQEQSTGSTGGAELGKAAAEVLDNAALKVSDGAASGKAEEKTGKLEANEEKTGKMEAREAEGQVELDDVYKQGVTSQIGQSSVLTKTVEESMSQVFLNSREVAYRLGRYTVNTQVTELEVTGIDNMRIMEISSNIDEMSLNVTFKFPEITFTGKFNATGSILNRKKSGFLVLRTPFPSYGNGNIKAVIANTTAVSQAELSHSFNDRKLSIELLTCHLTFGEPEVRLTEVTLPRALRKLHFERLFRVALGKSISHRLATEIEPKVDESLHDVITGVLDRVSLDEGGAADFASLGASTDAWKTV